MQYTLSYIERHQQNTTVLQQINQSQKFYAKRFMPFIPHVNS